MTRVHRTILQLLVEYIVITFPILIYVSMEALHHEDAAYLVKSPEWSIGTIFITIQTIRIFFDEMHDGSGRLFGYLLVLLLAVITVAAGLNIYIGLGDVAHPGMGTMLTKWGLFATASLVFIYIAGAAIYSAQ